MSASENPPSATNRLCAATAYAATTQTMNRQRRIALRPGWIICPPRTLNRQWTRLTESQRMTAIVDENSLTLWPGRITNTAQPDIHFYCFFAFVPATRDLVAPNNCFGVKGKKAEVRRKRLHVSFDLMSGLIADIA